jgi:hypothetical protein
MTMAKRITRRLCRSLPKLRSTGVARAGLEPPRADVDQQTSRSPPWCRCRDKEPRSNWRRAPFARMCLAVESELLRLTAPTGAAASLTKESRHVNRVGH